MVQDITQSAIEAAKESGFSESDKKGAEIALKRLQKKNLEIELDDDMVALYCAIRRIKQDGDPQKDVRISPDLLRHWRGTAYRSVELATDYYIVPKVNAPHWAGNAVVAKCIIPPDEFMELPAGVDTRAFDIMDDWAPREALGPNVRKMKLPAGFRRSKDMEGTQLSTPSSAPRLASAGNLEAGGQAPREPEDNGPFRKGVHATNDTWAAKARKLLRQPSDDTKRLQDAMEEIANEIATEFGEGNFVQHDKMARSAEVWCRKFYENLVALWGDWQQTHPNDDKVANELQFHAEADSFTKGLLGYIVNNLLTNATFDVLPQFVSILVRIRDVLPTFVGTLADVVIQLGQIKLDSQDEVDSSKLKFEEMSLWQ